MSQRYVKDECPLSDVTARIIAAATEVHRTLGPGFERSSVSAPWLLSCQHTIWNSAARSGWT